MKEKSLIQVARGEKAHRTPIWFLRQAGRYLPEYHHVRSKVSFLELCQSPQLVKEVTLQPLRRFDLDAAIIFSDILIPCTAMGQSFSCEDSVGPVLSNPVQSSKDVAALVEPNIERDLAYVAEALQLVKPALSEEQALIGFAGAPFTVASYMIEGKSSKNYQQLKRFCYNDPQAFRELIEFITTTTINYLKMQVKAGADCVMIFDSHAAQLAPADYSSLVAPAMRRLFAELNSTVKVPVIYYPGQGCELYPELSGMAIDVIAVDWRVRLTRAIHLLHESGLQVSVQGNLDPSVFIGSEEIIRAKSRSVLDEGGDARGHIFNVGHGLLPFLTPEAIAIAIDEVRRWDKDLDRKRKS